ncbi:hypothetical protein ACFQ51_25925 [Streptomyces kaempferi]
MTTGQGKAKYQVLGVRRAGDPAPAPVASGKGRLVLVTATGPHFMPGGVLRVDADLISTPARTPAAVIRSGTLPESEQPLAHPSGVPWPLVMWLQALVAVAVAAVWTWHRWGSAPDVDRVRTGRRGPGPPGRRPHHRTAPEPDVTPLTAVRLDCLPARPTYRPDPAMRCPT